MPRYQWQDVTHVPDSVMRHDPPWQMKNIPYLTKIALPPVRVERPLYLRLDPELWPMTIAVLALTSDPPHPDAWMDVLWEERDRAGWTLGMDPLA